jgi:putative SOS response-associated peptidase YedK
MCFTVAIVRNNVLQTIKQYYDSLPDEWKKDDMDIDLDLPFLQDSYFSSGFTNPQLPVIQKEGVFPMQWGLIPSWTKGPSEAKDIGLKTLNARSESVFEKSSFRKSIESRRGILPVLGFFEWQDVQKQKYPYFIYHPENKGFAMGAIFDKWLNPQTGQIVTSFSMVTTEANALMADIHNTKKRMPLIIPPESIGSWLHDNNPATIQSLMKPFDEAQMFAHTISRKANSTRENRDYPGIIEKVSYPELNQSQQLLF